MVNHHIIRMTGWGGLLINIIAIATFNTHLFLIGQVLSSISAFFWNQYLQKRVSIDLYISLSLTIAASITGNQWLMYLVMLSRSFTYQLVFERVVKERAGQGG